MFQDQRPYMNAVDEDAAKLKFKERQERMHKGGAFPFFKETVDLLIAVGVPVVIFAIFKWIL